MLKLFHSLNGETSQQNEKTFTSYSKMFNADNSSMKGTCNTYVQYSAQKAMEHKIPNCLHKKIL